LGKRPKSKHLSGRRNGPNGPEKCASLSATQGPLEKGHPRRACCGAPGECHLVLECDEIRFCKPAIFCPISEEASSSPKDNGLDEVNEGILLALSDELFFSVPSGRQITRKKCVPKRTGYRQLVDSLHFTFRHLHWVPHKLFNSQKARQVELSIQLRDFLLSMQYRGWQGILPVDESLFYLPTDPIMR
jgi:hypothetical protein